jgi:hypothetical protein
MRNRKTNNVFSKSFKSLMDDYFRSDYETDYTRLKKYKYQPPRKKRAPSWPIQHKYL